jgi:hypothetical protein
MAFLCEFHIKDDICNLVIVDERESLTLNLKKVIASQYWWSVLQHRT